MMVTWADQRDAQELLRVQLRALVERAPTYMEMEDLVRTLDGMSLDKLIVRDINRMRNALNDLLYLVGQSAETRL